jgi:hypothetical protein
MGFWIVIVVVKNIGRRKEDISSHMNIACCIVFHMDITFVLYHIINIAFIFITLSQLLVI